MRIIAGEFGGRRLKSIESPGLRPTTDRVRESIFNILSARIEFEGARALDLFAGTGALGIEAISRGATACDFVERERKALAIIRENLSSLDLLARGRIVNSDAIAFVGHVEGGYDIIFADPPYAASVFEKLIHTIFERSLLNDGGLLVVEHASTMRGHTREGIDLLLEREFGDSAISIYRSA